MQIIPLLFVIFVQKFSFFIRNGRNPPTRFANLTTYTPARLYGLRSQRPGSTYRRHAVPLLLAFIALAVLVTAKRTSRNEANS